jgi:hypothetical protein
MFNWERRAVVRKINSMYLISLEDGSEGTVVSNTYNWHLILRGSDLLGTGNRCVGDRV